MILIVDDDSAVRSSLSFMLKRAGYEVKTAPGPREMPPPKPLVS